MQILGGAGSIKADQLRNAITLLPVALFHAWNVNGKIPDQDAPHSRSKSKVAKSQAETDELIAKRRRAFLSSLPESENPQKRSAKDIPRNRNFQRHYQNILKLCVALRILGCRSLSPNEAQRGCTMLNQVFQEWASMGSHLTPYFHFATHLLGLFLRFGPAYGWWVMAYERNNGTLVKFNHNGHAGGELEGTLMRAWWKSLLVQDLVCDHDWIVPSPCVHALL